MIPSLTVLQGLHAEDQQRIKDLEAESKRRWGHLRSERERSHALAEEVETLKGEVRDLRYLCEDEHIIVKQQANLHSRQAVDHAENDEDLHKKVDDLGQQVEDVYGHRNDKAYELDEMTD